MLLNRCEDLISMLCCVYGSGGWSKTNVVEENKRKKIKDDECTDIKQQTTFSKIMNSVKRLA